MRLILFFLFIFLLPTCCSSKKNHMLEPVSSEPDEIICNLHASTSIVMQLIVQNRLAEMLENASSQEIERFIKNTSPAKIALEIEGLASAVPVILFFFSEKNNEYFTIRTQLKHILLADKNVKCLEIDDQELFSLSHDAEVDTFPAIVVVYKKQEKGRIEGRDMIDNLEDRVRMILTSLQA